MLNRRILRIKAFKTIFSYAENPAMTLEEVKSQFTESCESTRSLYLFMLAVIPALTGEARARIENAKKKINKTEEEMNPNLKFVENRIAAILSGDPDFKKVYGRLKLSWEQYDVILRNTFDSILSKDYFRTYMSDPERSLALDSKLFIKIFEEEFVDSEELAKVLEDLSIWWNDDLAYSLSVCCDTLKALGKGQNWSLPPLYKSQMDPDSAESDRDFIFKVLSTSYANWSRFAPMVAANSDQWKEDRLFTTDTVLIVMGLSEAKAFPALPARITINEYVEISKYYSTPKSRSFVNGLLDRLIKKLVGEGEIVKTENFA